MSKLDEVKETLNTLRVVMSIFFGVFVVIVGKIVTLYEAQNLTALFWISIVASIISLIAIIVIVKKIAKKTKEIKDL